MMRPGRAASARILRLRIGACCGPAFWRASLRNAAATLALLTVPALATAGAGTAPARAAGTGLALATKPAPAPVSSSADPVLARVKAAGALRVCIWPDYYGITYRDPRTLQLSGLDIDLTAELAQDLKVRVEYVDATVATLIDDVSRGRCEVATFASMLARNVANLRFTRPHLRSDIYGVTTRGNRLIHSWADIDKPGVVVGVLPGNYIEMAMSEALKQARLVVVRPPATRERDLEAGRIDVFMTNYAYSQRLLDNADWAVRIAPPLPFYPQNYAYAVKLGDDEWFAVVDGFVRRIQRDGRLDAAAQRHGLRAIDVLH